VTPEDLHKVVDDIATAIQHIANDLESREKSGDLLDQAEVRAVARRLQTHAANLMSAVGRIR
jgi:uncharacterized protein YutE (UPF0331/DUF86 family)